MQGTNQFEIVKPVMAILSLTMLGVGQYNSPLYQTFLLLVYNMSYSIALYCLVCDLRAVPNACTHSNIASVAPAALLLGLSEKSRAFQTSAEILRGRSSVGALAVDSIAVDSFIVHLPSHHLTSHHLTSH
jgi:hypothetical protein